MVVLLFFYSIRFVWFFFPSVLFRLRGWSSAAAAFVVPLYCSTYTPCRTHLRGADHYSRFSAAVTPTVEVNPLKSARPPGESYCCPLSGGRGPRFVITSRTHCAWKCRVRTTISSVFDILICGKSVIKRAMWNGSRPVLSVGRIFY